MERSPLPSADKWPSQSSNRLYTMTRLKRDGNAVLIHPDLWGILLTDPGREDDWVIPNTEGGDICRLSYFEVASRASLIQACGRRYQAWAANTVVEQMQLLAWKELGQKDILIDRRRLCELIVLVYKRVQIWMILDNLVATGKFLYFGQSTYVLILSTGIAHVSMAEWFENKVEIKEVEE